MALSAAQLARMSRLLDEALPLQARERQQWLQELSAEDTDLLDALRQALADDGADHSADLTTLPKVGDERDARLIGTLRPGSRVGPYQLARLLGSGGMAEVWLAQRADGVLRRDVALKLPVLIRLRNDLASRFARERDILAALEHPNIARLYDAGVSTDGLPYLAMEYVAGQPLTAWCDARRLELSDRLTLFLQVLDAVQYAHARQVLHRDIKPSNILVTESGQVRLLDFGVAKLLVEEEDQTQLTQLYGRALTPEYASPELLRGDPVDAGSDVYALGVVLYELLAGNRPYRLKPGASLATLERAIDEARVQRPSTRVQSDAALARASTADRLSRRLRGDLDAVVLKALERRPQDRYASAQALAEDLQRYLSGEAVRARSAHPAYRLAKFLGRHPGSISAAALIIALVAALAYEVIQMSETRPGQQAPAAEQPPADDRSIAVLPFADISEKKDQEYFSDGLSEELIARLSRSPDLRVIARTSSFYFKGKQATIGEIASALGVSHVLEGSVRKAGAELRISAQLIRASDGSSLWSQTYERKFNDIFQVQDEIAGTVAAALKAALASGPRAPAGQPDGEAYSLLLQGNYFLNRFSRPHVEKAIGLYKQAIEIDPDFAAAWTRLSWATWIKARFGWTAIKPAYQSALKQAQRALRIDPGHTFALSLLGVLYRDYDWNWDAARAQFERAIQLDPNDVVDRVRLAALKALRSGQFGDLIHYEREALLRDPLDAPSLWNLGESLFFAGRVDESAAAWRKALEASPDFFGAHARLGLALLFMQRPAEALVEVRGEPDEVSKLAALSVVHWAMDQRAESDAALRRLTETLPDVAAYNIATAHAFRGEADAAFEWLDRAAAQHDPGLPNVKFDPLLRKLQGDRRLQALLVRLKLAD